MFKQIIVNASIFVSTVTVLLKVFALDENPYIRLVQSVLASINAMICSRPLKIFYSIVHRKPVEPKDLNNLTIEWLNYVLSKYFRSCGKPDVRKIIDFRVQKFEDGALGETGRIFLTYNTGNYHPTLPNSIVVKLARKDFKGLVMNINATIYKEILFYERFSYSTPLRVPKLLYSNVDSYLWHACNFVLVTEDIYPSKTIIDSSLMRSYFDKEYYKHMKEMKNIDMKRWSIRSSKRYSLKISDVEEVCDAITKHHAFYLNNKNIIQRKNLFLGPQLAYRLDKTEGAVEAHNIQTFLNDFAWFATRRKQDQGLLLGTRTLLTTSMGAIYTCKHIFLLLFSNNLLTYTTSSSLHRAFIVTMYGYSMA
jgi:hypothetical protein